MLGLFLSVMLSSHYKTSKKNRHSKMATGGGWPGSPVAEPPPPFLVAVPGGVVRAEGALPAVPVGGGVDPNIYGSK